jgi:cytochrome c oxidase subunit 1
MRAPGMTWFRLPLFVWAHYATSIIFVLGTPVLAISIVLVGWSAFSELESSIQARRRSSAVPASLLVLFASGGIHHDPSGHGVMSEVITCFARKKIFGYNAVAFSSLAIAILGFLVWDITCSSAGSRSLRD